MTHSTTLSAHVGNCALCDTENIELRESHIIPKFVYQWLKSTSKTPYIRGGDDVNARLQDGPKKYLLCGSCEGLLSTMENDLAQNMFRKIANYRQQTNKITVTESMQLAVLSVFWRSILVSRNRENTRTYEDNAMLDSFSRSLKAQIKEGKCKFNIYYAPFHGTPPYYNLPPEATYQLERSIGEQDVRFFDNPHRFFATFKIPFMYFYIFSEGWPEDEVKKSTAFTTGDLIIYDATEIPDALRTHIHRMQEHFENMKLQMSQTNIEKIIRDITKNTNITGSDKSRARTIGIDLEQMRTKNYLDDQE